MTNFFKMKEPIRLELATPEKAEGLFKKHFVDCILACTDWRKKYGDPAPRIKPPAPENDTIWESFEAWDRYIKASKEYLKRFEKTKNPEVVIEFIRQNHFALNDPWVMETVATWHQNGELDLIKRALFPHKGERPGKLESAMRDSWLTFQIDWLVRQGLKKTWAFQVVNKPPFGFNLTEKRIRQIYYATKMIEKKPQAWMQKDGETIIITVFPFFGLNFSWKSSQDGRIISTTFTKWFPKKSL